MSDYTGPFHLAEAVAKEAAERRSRLFDAELKFDMKSDGTEIPNRLFGAEIKDDEAI